jgi:predicted phage terminase large subunit-like protein
MKSAGVDGAITGFRAHCLIIDDPIENQKEAHSPVQREAIWQTYLSVLETRLEPPATQIIVMTRWHQDDICGRILQRDGTIEDGGLWRLLKFPAIAEDDDEIGRKEGEALWPEKYSAEYWREEMTKKGSYWSQAMYQQDPQPPAGSRIARESFRYFHSEGEILYLDQGDGTKKRIPREDCVAFQTVDTAQKIGQENDYTVVLTCLAGPNGEIIFDDIMRAKIEVPRQYGAIRAAGAKYNGELRFQAVEDKVSGTGLIQQARLDGQPFRVLKADRDKGLRADALEIAYENGMVYHRAGAPWLVDFEDELLWFPNGTHDDQVDTAAYAAILVRKGVARKREIEIL